MLPSVQLWFRRVLEEHICYEVTRRWPNRAGEELSLLPCFPACLRTLSEPMCSGAPLLYTSGIRTFLLIRNTIHVKATTISKSFSKVANAQ